MIALEILLLVGLVIFVTHTIEAVTGFGCTVLAFPFVIFLIKDLEQAKIILSILALALAVYFAVTKFNCIHWKQFGIIIFFAGLGMPIGMLVFKSLHAEILKKALGVFIVISAVIQLYKCFTPTITRSIQKLVRRITPTFIKNNLPKFKKSSAPTSAVTSSISHFFGYIFLFTGGIVHGVFAVGGPLVILYTAGKIPVKGQFRATMCLLWTILNTVLMFQLKKKKKLSLNVGLDLLILLPFLIAGIITGEAIHKKVNEMLFRKIVFISLFLVGIVMCI
jgi:uncharacterized membrane protein YfcA